MENQAAKRIREEDRISELPQHILHHILSFFSQKQSVQTCVLAKSWSHLGSTRPKLEFSECCFTLPSFIDIVDKTLQRYEDQNLSIQEFLLEVPGERSGIVPFLDKWIPKVLSLRGLKKLCLDFYSYIYYSPHDPFYALPQVVFQAVSIQELSLVECRIRISSADKIMLKNLQTLHLRDVEIEEQTFERIMSSCPLIQYLVLKLCPGLCTVKVKNAHNLKKFDCRLYAHNDPSIEIDPPTTLQSIRIENCPDWYCYHDNNKFFPNLKSLYMNNVRLSEESFDIFSSNNTPCLEDLELAFCYGFENFELSSRSIKRLIIKMVPKSTFSAAIDAPNILYFELSCEMSSPFSFTKTSSCGWKSNISVTCCLDSNSDRVSTWFLELDEMLKALSQSQITLCIKTDCCGNYFQRIEGTYEGFNEPVVVENLSLPGLFSSSIFPGFLNYLFSICRPRYIYTLPHTYRESLCKVLVQEREMMDSSWQQNLEDISTEEEKDNDGEEWLASRLSTDNKRLRLKWRE